MNKLILATIATLALHTPCHAQKDSTITALKQQQEVLKLNSELKAVEMDYQKAVQETSALEKEAAEVNAVANVNAPTNFSTDNAAATAKEAKERVKMLKEVNKTNKKLASKRKRVSQLSQKQKKIKAKLNNMDQKIKFVNQ